jgi:hypothetical protein
MLFMFLLHSIVQLLLLYCQLHSLKLLLFQQMHICLTACCVCYNIGCVGEAYCQPLGTFPCLPASIIKAICNLTCATALCNQLPPALHDSSVGML